MAEIYRFKEDLFAFIAELKDQFNISEANPKLTPELYEALQKVEKVFKEEKHPIYVLQRKSKLLLDKSLFKPNYTLKEDILLIISTLNLWQLIEDPFSYYSLVLIDKKHNLLKQIGGIPQKPERENVKFHVVYHDIYKDPSKKIEISKNMKAIKLSDSDLAFMKDIMAKAREKVLSPLT